MITNVLEYLEASVLRTPSKKAFADQSKSIAYQQLMDKAQRIAAFILKAEKFRNRPIAVIIDRNIESLILFLGVVYSGNFYVPVDHTMPEQRIQLIMDTLNPVMVLSSVKDISWKNQKIVDFDAAVSACEADIE